MEQQTLAMTTQEVFLCLYEYDNSHCSLYESQRTIINIYLRRDITNHLLKDNYLISTYFFVPLQSTISCDF